MKQAVKKCESLTLTLYMSQSSSEMCTYFCKDLVTGYCLYLVKDSIHNHHPFSDQFH